MCETIPQIQFPTLQLQEDLAHCVGEGTLYLKTDIFLKFLNLAYSLTLSKHDI